VFLLPAGYDSLEPEETCQRHDPPVKSGEKNYKKVVVSNIVDFQPYLVKIAILDEHIYHIFNWACSPTN